MIQSPGGIETWSLQIRVSACPLEWAQDFSLSYFSIFLEIPRSDKV
jgi:hypothetical protein